MEEDFKYGLMGHYMKDIGKTTRQMERVDSFMQMVMCMKATGKMTKPMATEFTCMLMERDTKVSGRKTNSMEKV